MKKYFFMILCVITACVIMTGCDKSSVNPTAPASTPEPQAVPTELATMLVQATPEATVDAAYTYTSSTADGSVDWTVNTDTAGHIPGIGEHSGELQWLSVHIIFQAPYFYTSQGYAGYYIGLPMNYEITLTNTGNRKYNHIDVAAIQEYYETGTTNRWWYPYPQDAAFSKGEAMPGDSAMYWRDLELDKGQSITLKGTYTAPIATCDGLDQVHLIIQHTNNGAIQAATMYYNPEAAVYCPPPPSQNP